MRTCKIYLMEKSELNLVFLLKKAPHLQCTTTAMYMYMYVAYGFRVRFLVITKIIILSGVLLV